MKKLTKLKLPFSIRQNLKLITEIDEVEVQIELTRLIFNGKNCKSKAQINFEKKLQK